MKYVTHHGTRVPALGFGTFRMQGTECENAVRWALETGYRHIDTAQRYENEAEVGKAIAGFGIARDEIFLTTKLSMDNLSAPLVASSTAASLDRLRTDYVDLLLIHWPDARVTLAETLGAMRAQQTAGRARHIGLSNFTIPMIEEAVDVIGATLFTNQIEYHPLLRQPRLNDAIFARDMLLTGHSALATGRLADDPVLLDIGRKYGKTPAQVAIRWQLEQDRVMVLPKSKRRATIAENFDVFDFELSDADMAAIGGLSRNARGVTPPFAPKWDPNE